MSKRKCNIKSAERKKKITYIMAFIFSLIFLGAIIGIGCMTFGNNIAERNALKMYLLFAIVYTILPIVYLYTLCKLSSTMKSLLGADDISSERDSVLR